ncbi:hypothetical protein CkaCkLH20_12392 [Colletotrichum karsti]|uniref:Uncharacterized protein n=1 Tax=Colletotrichum karsti TaxID=1095194 RepID=A0A9P6HSQ8_9PEZI|nr:uncharacterized protein CkaCkLH20_12392 [Colletotrichum karsti]KAF9870158.1 hypothetical protein CkaCkLH20_12392 [Colletotrichum karsti]
MLYNMSYPHDHPGAPQPAVAGQQPFKSTLAAAAPGGVARPKQRCSQPMPFDPEELSQKLNKVIADRQLYAERRRRARADVAAATAAGVGPQCPTQPPHTSMARECLDQGSLKPGRSHSILSPLRPRTEPIARKPVPPRERPDTSAARPKSKMSDDSQSSKSKDSSKRKGSGEKHHYIPQFAASQFTRTTTTADNMPEGKGLVHKLSRTALRIAQAHRERHQQERNNFYSDRVPETTEEASKNDRAHRDKNHHRHTIEVAPAGRNEDHQARAARRASTGADVLLTWDSDASSPNPYGHDNPDVADHDPNEHRVDWTQSDEAPRQQPQPRRQKSRPSLRKADSLWALKNKLGSFTKHRSEDQQQRSRDGSPPSSDSTPRSPKSGFFARFKVTH